MRSIGRGSVDAIAASTISAVVPSNALRPASISYSTQPNAKMSARSSPSLPFNCSGEMYCRVPDKPLMLAPPDPLVSASDAEMVSFRVEAACDRRDVALGDARPKSMSFTSHEPGDSGFATSITLPGFKSRCTIPA